MRGLRHIRFSLRTLLLSVLLIGSSATLWWNASPWAPALHIDSLGPIDRCEFSPNGRWIAAKFEERNGLLDGGGQVLHVFDARSGVLKLSKGQSAHGEASGFRFSPGGRFVYYAADSLCYPTLYELATGATIELSAIVAQNEELQSFSFSDGDNFALLQSPLHWRLVELSDLNIVDSFPATSKVRLSDDGRRLLLADGRQRLLIADEDIPSTVYPRVEKSCPIPKETQVTANPDFAIRFGDGETLESVISTRSNSSLFSFSNFRWRNEFQCEFGCEFAPSSPDFATWSDVTEPNDSGSRACRITLWRLTRPYEWYGLAWMPEFWTMLLFSISLAASVIADAKLRRLAVRAPVIGADVNAIQTSQA